MNIAVVFAGGVGTRMKSENGIPKQFLKIKRAPILVWTLKNFQNDPLVDKIVVVMVNDYIDYTWKLVKKYKLNKVEEVVAGGKTGQDSIYNGLIIAKELAKRENPIVLTHDGVRPFIEADLIARNISSVERFGSAISSVPSKETIIQLEKNEIISNVVDRSTVWMARAPQSFYLNDILEAHELAIKSGRHDIIDSCTMMMNFGKKLHMVETQAENIKITTPEDYYVACGLIAKRKK